MSTSTSVPSAGTTVRLYAIGGLGGILYGYGVVAISGALLFISKQFNLSSGAQGIVVSSALWGAIIGAAFGGHFSDRAGRRPVMLIAAVLFTIGSLGEALAATVTMLVVFRVILGLGVGIAFTVAPIYLAEVSPAHIRGRLTSLSTIMLAIGVVIASVVDYALSGPGAWRYMLGIGAVFGILLFVGMLLQPESPRWLFSRGRSKQANDSIARFGLDVDKHALTSLDGHEKRGVLRHLRELTDPRIRPILALGIGLALFQQFTGNAAVINYTPTVLARDGFSASNAVLGGIGINVVDLAFIILAGFLMDRVGRRRLLVVGTAGMAVCLAAISIFEYSGAGSHSGVATLVALLAYFAFEGVSWAVVAFVVIAELFPQKSRSYAVGLCMIVVLAADLLLELVFPTVLSTVGEGAVFAGFAIISVAALLVVLRWLPETRGTELPTDLANEPAGVRSAGASEIVA